MNSRSSQIANPNATAGPSNSRQTIAARLPGVECCEVAAKEGAEETKRSEAALGDPTRGKEEA